MMVTRRRAPSREEAYLLMSALHKVHGNVPNQANPPAMAPTLPPVPHAATEIDFMRMSTSPADVLSLSPPGYMTMPDTQMYYQHNPAAHLYHSQYTVPQEQPLTDPSTRKKIQKKQGNRLAAKRCRERKKQYISYLEERCVNLEASIRTLQNTLQEIQPDNNKDNIEKPSS
eukprot:m.49597 g.49597  ORF g.49597 m.49597 type:complete len:171 (-) comp7133_c0_seq1:473-985(-)